MNRNTPIPLNVAVANHDGFCNNMRSNGIYKVAISDRIQRHDQIIEYSSMPKSKRPLPVDYIPSPNTVVIGRGKFCTDAAGSKRLRNIAATFLNEYSKANTKAEKSSIVSIIVDIVEEGCPYGGAFVKHIGGRWWEVDNSAAREKVGYVLRDLLHDQYRSSSKSKAANRRRKIVKSHPDTQKGQYTDESCSQSSVDSSVAAPSFSNEELQRSQRRHSSDDFQERDPINQMVVAFETPTLRSAALTGRDYENPRTLSESNQESITTPDWQAYHSLFDEFNRAPLTSHSQSLANNYPNSTFYDGGRLFENPQRGFVSEAESHNPMMLCTPLPTANDTAMRVHMSNEASLLQMQRPMRRPRNSPQPESIEPQINLLTSPTTDYNNSMFQMHPSSSPLEMMPPLPPSTSTASSTAILCQIWTDLHGIKDDEGNPTPIAETDFTDIFD